MLALYSKMFKCEFCSTTFKAKYNLNAHIKSAKYCMAMRGTTKNLKCNGCEKNFGNNVTLERHTKTCKSIIIKGKDDEIVILKQRISSLEDENHKLKLDNSKLELKLESSKLEVKADIYKEEYHAIRDRPTTTYNSTTNRLKLINISTIDPFTVDTVKNRLKSGVYSYEEFLRGVIGIQEFILNMVIKGKELSYTIVDVTRPNYQRLEDSREWVPDINAHFIGIVFDEMKLPIKEYYDRFNDEDAACKTEKEHERFDIIRERINPVYRGITKTADNKDRKTLQSKVISYIKPRIVAPSK